MSRFASTFWKRLRLGVFVIPVFAAAENLPALEITSDYSGGTITNGMDVNPGSSNITISGTTTVSGIASSYGLVFREGSGIVTLAEGAVITLNGSNSEKAFLYGSNVVVDGTINVNTASEAGRFRIGVGGATASQENPVASNLTVRGAINVKTQNTFIILCAGGTGSANPGMDALQTQNILIDGGTLSLSNGNQGIYLGSRNHLNVTIQNGGTFLAETTGTNNLYICGGPDDWTGQENKRVTFDIQNGQMTLDSQKGIQIGTQNHSVTQASRETQFTIGSAGTLQFNQSLTAGYGPNGSRGTASFTINGGTLYAAENAVSIDSFFPIEVSGGAKIKVDNELSLGQRITGSGGITKQGEGTLIFNTTMNYSGTTTIEEGKLVLNAQHGGTVPSRDFIAAEGTVLELMQKNATGWGVNSPNITLNAGAEMYMNIEQDSWSSVRKLTMGDGAAVNARTDIKQRLYLCDTMTVLENSSAVLNTPVSLRTIMENQGAAELKNAGKFMISSGARLDITEEVLAWSTSSSPITNPLIKQGSGEMYVHGTFSTTDASNGSTVSVEVQDGLLVLYDTERLSSAKVTGADAVLLMEGVIEANDTLTIAEGAGFGAVNTLTLNQPLDLSGRTWTVALSSETPSTLNLPADSSLILDGESAMDFFFLDDSQISDLISLGELELLRLADTNSVTLPEAAQNDWNYFLTSDETLDEYFNLVYRPDLTGGGSLYLAVDTNAVPEPSTCLLLLAGAGFLAISGLKRRRRND